MQLSKKLQTDYKFLHTLSVELFVIFLDRPSKDVDILVVGNGIEFAQAVAKRYPPP